MIAANAGVVEEYRAGDDKVRKKKRNFLLGAAMAATENQGNPRVIGELLDRRLQS